VVHSEEREHYERGLHELSMERTRQQLEALRVRVEKGEIKKAERSVRPQPRSCRRNHGHRNLPASCDRDCFSIASIR
jgi:hypothetical protein